MKRTQLSPVTSLLVSLSLVVGILVCDLAGAHALPAAHAQTSESRVFHQVAVPAATLAGSVIAAKGVVINGVATDAVFVGGIRVSNSVVEASGGVYVSGAFPAGVGDIIPNDGAFPSGNIADLVDGAFPAGVAGEPIELDGAFPSGNITVNGSLAVIGGTLEGSNIQVKDGVVSGDNLVLVGACVTNSGAQ